MRGIPGNDVCADCGANGMLYFFEKIVKLVETCLYNNRLSKSRLILHDDFRFQNFSPCFNQIY